MKLEINKLKPNQANPRIIKDKKFKKLIKSIKEFPEMLDLRPIVVAEDMTILGGNMRYKACIDAGLKEVPVTIAKGLTDAQKQEFIVKDNVGFGEWEWDMLANEWDSVELAEWGLDVWENQDDVIEEEDETYTRKIVAPTYEPKNKKPELKDLFNTDKADELIHKIKQANLSEEETLFLSHCALRHTVYDYSKIADFYAHSSKEVQKLMEDSALVIIDFDKAIENGYVKLTKEIAASYKKNGIL
tara:strand:+ start:1359 stop:2090 length:732 start_codon:yes stop_codon:yes gene_type:complete